MHIPQYSGILSVDGQTYQVTIRITEGELASNLVPVHSHGQCEILAFMDGGAVMQVGDAPEITVQRGQCCVIHPNVYHMRRKSSDLTRCGTVFIQRSSGTPLQKLDGTCTLLKCAPVILACLNAMEQEFSSPALGSDSNIQSLASLILVAVLRELSGLQLAQTVQRRRTVLNYEDIIDDYLALHYAEDLRIDELAEQAGITSRQLARIMQQRYRCTFQQRLTGIRLFHAKKYLSETEQPVGNIAILCGFASESSFSTTFRKHVGCSPSQYRRNSGKEP